MSIKTYESAVRSCFGEESIQDLWYGGTEGKIGDDQNKMYVAITEGEDWWANRCILRDWFFDYKKFETLPLEIDCERYGVYVVWEDSSTPQTCKCPACDTQRTDVEFKTDLGNGDEMVCEDCYNRIEEEEEEEEEED